MSELPSEAFLEAQIAAHLDQQARTVEVRRIWQQIQARLVDTERQTWSMRARSPLQGSKLRRKARWGVVTAAGILLLILSTLSFTAAPLSAAVVMQQTTRTHQLPTDRLYELEIQPDANLQQRFPALPPARPFRSLVWTRGQAFWVEMKSTDPAWRWGRDPQGRVWLALNRQLGLRFDGNEIPDQLHEFMALRSADVPAILRDVLTHCELHDETVTPTQRVIRAQGRAIGHPFPVLSAVLEIDPLRHELRTLSLLRGDVRGRPLGTITLTLIRQETQPAERYQLEHYLHNPFQVVDHQQPIRRMRLFLQHLTHP